MFLLDIVQVTFWYVVFKAYQLAMAMAMSLIPTALVKQVAMKEFAEHKIKISFDGDKDVGKYDKKKYGAEIVVYNPKVFKRVQVEDILGMGESYMVRCALLMRAGSLKEILLFLLVQRKNTDFFQYFFSLLEFSCH